MIFRTPYYYNNFRCIADKCKDNCCIGWEIDIDYTTAEKYKAITGNFGKRLKENIDFSGQPSFILGENERCPFLNSCNLCDIITELGEKSLCQICSDHPRYYEWYGNIKEGGIGMCCEEAARIILNSPLPFSFDEKEIPDEDSTPCDEKLYNLIFNLRERIISILNNENYPLADAFSDTLSLAAAYQKCADNNLPEPENIPEMQAAAADIKEILIFLLTLETMDEKWHPMLKNAVENADNLISNQQKFFKKNPKIAEYMRNIAIYYICRYLLKGIFDGEFYSAVALAVTSTIVITFLWELKWLTSGLSEDDCIEIAKNYSKEIEYSEENTDAMLNEAYENPAMAAESLTAILRNFM